MRNWISLLLIIFSFIFFDDPNQHPSFLTLIPVIGCCLIIIDKDSNNSINKFLSHKLLVNIGLISYSLYLWHHPILSFGKISGITDGSIFFKILLILLSFVLSALTYHMVEKKLRNSNFISFKFIKLSLFKLRILSSSLVVVVCCRRESIERRRTRDRHSRRRRERALSEASVQRGNDERLREKLCSFLKKFVFCFPREIPFPRD